jgi:peroxiredoxin
VAGRLRTRGPVIWIGAALAVIGAVVWIVTVGPGGSSTADLGSDAPSETAAWETGLSRYRVADRRPAPDVAGSTLDGERLSLADLRGHVVVVNVWGSWCVPCREEAPDLARVARETRAQGVRFVGLDVRDNPASARAFVRRYGITYPSLVDSNGSLLLAFDGIIPISAVPSTVVIDPEGRIAARVIGKTTYRTLRGVIDDVLAEPRG